MKATINEKIHIQKLQLRKPIFAQRLILSQWLTKEAAFCRRRKIEDAIIHSYGVSKKKSNTLFFFIQFFFSHSFLFVWKITNT